MLSRAAFVAFVLLVAGAGAASAAPANASDADFRVTLTQTGITKLTDIVIDVLNQNFSSIQLPDIHLSPHVPVIGHLTLDLTSIQISGFGIKSWSFKLGQPSDMSLSLDNIGLTLTMDYKWRRIHWPHASDHGVVTVTPGDGDISLDLRLSVDSNGRPHVQCVSDSASFGSFDINFQGKVAWLYNLLVDLLKNTLAGVIGKAVSSQLEQIVDNKANAALQKFPLSLTLGGGKSRSNVDLALTDVSVASVTESILTVGDSFLVANNMTGKACPIAGVALPYVTPSAAWNMLQLLLADAAIECLVFTPYTNGALQHTFDNSNFPKGLPVNLNTSSWQSLIPALYSHFPNKLMILDVSAAAAPNVTTSPTTGLGADALFDVSVSIVNATGNASATTYAFTLGARLVMALDVAVANEPGNTTLHANVTALKIQLGVVGSAIGPVDVSRLDGLIGLLTPIVQAVVNGAISGGIPLPLQGLHIANPTVNFETGYLSITSNFTVGATKLAPPPVRKAVM